MRFPQSSARAPLAAQSAFSLIEITLSIGIIAFAFVGLFGLLPTGLQIFRNSVDVANETWIMQNLNSMVQVTEWPQIVRNLGQPTGDIYYFDEEARLTDTRDKPSGEPEVLNRRLYAAKLFVEQVYHPNSTSQMVDARRIVAVLVNVANPRVMKEFEGIGVADDVAKLPKDTQVRARAFLVTRMDSELSTRTQ